MADKTSAHNIFIAHNNETDRIVISMRDLLSSYGHEVFTYLNIDIGEKWDSNMQAALENADVLIVIISSRVLQSDYMRQEVEMAIKDGKRIFPFKYGEAELPEYIRDYYVAAIDEKNYAEIVLKINEELRDEQPGSQQSNKPRREELSKRSQRPFTVTPESNQRPVVGSAFKGSQNDTKEISEHLEAVKRLAAQPLPANYQRWLAAVEDAYKEYEEILRLRGATFNFDYERTGQTYKTYGERLLRLLWLRKDFGSVGQSQMSEATFQANIPMLWNATRQLLDGVKFNQALQTLMGMVSIKPLKSELHASKLRAILVMKGLEVPAMFSEWRYDVLCRYLGLREDIAFPDGLNNVKHLIESLVPNQTKYFYYIFPWVIFDMLARPGSIPVEEQSATVEDVFAETAGGESHDDAKEGDKPEPKYFLFSINDNFSLLQKDRVGETSKHFILRSDSQDHEDFLKVNIGDWVIAIMNPSGRMGIAYKVIDKETNTQSDALALEIDDVEDERILLWSSYADRAPADVIRRMQGHWALIHLESVQFLEDGFAQHLRRIPLSSRPNDRIQTRLHAEGDFTHTEDKLGFENDYRSFASVICLRTVRPPLAIGLFGKWGAGKSFFMDKLQTQIEENIEPKSGIKNPNYVQDVVPVRFNSWHYSDSNLWASLILKIFDALHQYACKKNDGKGDSVHALYAKLRVTEIAVAETQKKIDEVQITVSKLEEQNRLKQEQIDKRAKGITLIDIGEALTEDSDVKIWLARFKKDFATGISLDEDIEKVQKEISDLNTFRNKAEETMKMVYNQPWRICRGVLGILLAGAVIAYLAYGPLESWVHTSMQKAAAAVLSALGTILAISATIRPYYEKATIFFNKLNAFSERIEKKKEGLKAQIERENQDALNRLKSEKAELEAQLQGNKNQKGELEKQLEDIRTGKLLATFLKDKVADENYIKQLGIISWIRQDIEMLCTHFDEQDEATKQAGDKNAAADPKVLRVDRIILYIDDLDRCDVEVVVKVLQAIHLLLAFRLFVVVVGVDPRWLNNALDKKYETLFGANKNRNVKDPGADKEKTKDAGTDTEELQGIASSYDYLEKIFQIPFALKPMNKQAKQDLVGYLTQSELQKEKLPDPPPKPDPGKTDLLPQPDPGKPDPNPQPDPGKTDPLPQPDPGKTDTPPPPVAEVIDLTFSKEEIAYMQKMALLFGHTPRTINRFINIYRIIRSHGDLVINGDSYSADDYEPNIILLSIIVGYAGEARAFVHMLDEADKEDTCEEIISRSGLPDDVIKYIIAKTSSEVLEMKASFFGANLRLIARFCFRSLMEEKSELLSEIPV